MKLVLRTPVTPLGASSDYVSPAVATSHGRRNRGAQESVAGWSTPPGWKDSALLDLPVTMALRAGLILREMGDSLVIHDPVTLDTHSLNATAAVLLLLCNGQRTGREVCAAFAGKFHLHPSAVRSEVALTLTDLVDKKVIACRPKNQGS